MLYDPYVLPVKPADALDWSEFDNAAGSGATIVAALDADPNLLSAKGERLLLGVTRYS